MTFEEWWESIDKHFSRYSIEEEVKWFTKKAWDAAVNEMIINRRKRSLLREIKNGNGNSSI